ncbi:MAG: hypothetical protein L0027_05195 [Candidatus Rokubacteria bacterium]|nr:hypothetical protein [Candidatus Rokubacteria bacterium]
MITTRLRGQTSDVQAHDTALTSPGSGHLRAVDRPLGQCDVDGARRVWENAHLPAGEGLAWEALIEAGQACLRRGATTGGPPDAEPAARRAYFAALYRACRENSFEGILRAAEAFADLGDREVVEECLGLVALRAEGEQTRGRVAAFVVRLGLTHTLLKADAAADMGVAWTDAAQAGGRGEPHDH